MRAASVGFESYEPSAEGEDEKYGWVLAKVNFETPEQEVEDPENPGTPRREGDVGKESWDVIFEGSPVDVIYVESGAMPVKRTMVFPFPVVKFTVLKKQMLNFPVEKLLEYLGKVNKTHFTTQKRKLIPVKRPRHRVARKPWSNDGPMKQSKPLATNYVSIAF